MRKQKESRRKKERKIAHSQGLTFKMLASKGEITEAHRRGVLALPYEHHREATAPRLSQSRICETSVHHFFPSTCCLPWQKEATGGGLCAVLYRGTGLYGRYWGHLS
ncbi:MAG: N-acetyltransferase [Myxococcales bacterium]|nr:N-acetyltransferase [Myxococcales bacterium]